MRCARVSLAEALLRLSQHIDGVARAGSAGTNQERVERALLGPAHHVGARRREPHAFGDQLGLGDEANSQIADGYATGSSELAMA
jgi:hypothetical protein